MYLFSFTDGIAFWVYKYLLLLLDEIICHLIFRWFDFEFKLLIVLYILLDEYFYFARYLFFYT